MSLKIDGPEAGRLARELAALTGESITEAVTTALRERLARLRRPHRPDAVLVGVAEIQAFVASLPDRHPRTPDEVPGYDASGLPR